MSFLADTSAVWRMLRGQVGTPWTDRLFHGLIAISTPVESELMRTVRALAQAGRSVIFISHKLREVLAVADRIAVLRRGKLVRQSPQLFFQFGDAPLCRPGVIVEVRFGTPLPLVELMAKRIYRRALSASPCRSSPAHGGSDRDDGFPAVDTAHAAGRESPS